MAWEETGEIAASDLREGERVKASITGEVTCIHNGGVRIDAVEPKGRTYAVWFYPDQDGVTVERVEDIWPGDVYRDASGDIVQAGDQPNEWRIIGSSELWCDYEIPRPLHLLYRPEADS